MDELVVYEDVWFELSREERLQLTAQKVYKINYDDADTPQKKVLRSLDVFKVSQKLKTENKAIPLDTLQGVSHIFFHKDLWELSAENKKCVHQWLIRNSIRHPVNYDTILQQMGANWLDAQTDTQLKLIKKLPNIAIAKRFFSAKYLELSELECNAIDDFKKVINEQLAALSTVKIKPTAAPSNVTKLPTTNQVPSNSIPAAEVKQEKIAAVTEESQDSSICLHNVVIKTEPLAADEQLEPQDSHKAAETVNQDEDVQLGKKSKEISQAHEEPLVAKELFTPKEPPVPEVRSAPVELPVREKLSVPKEPVVSKEPCDEVEPPVQKELPVPEVCPVPEEPAVPVKPPVPEGPLVHEEFPVPKEPPGPVPVELPVLEKPLVSEEVPLVEKSHVEKAAENSICTNSNIELNDSETANLPNTTDTTKTEEETAASSSAGDGSGTKSNEPPSAKRISKSKWDETSRKKLDDHDQSSEKDSKLNCKASLESHKPEQEKKKRPTRKERLKASRANSVDSEQSGSRRGSAHTKKDDMNTSRDAKSSAEPEPKDSTQLSQAYANIETHPVKSKAPFDPEMYQVFKEKLNLLKKILLEYLQVSAKDLNLDPLQINLNNSLHYGKNISALIREMCSVEDFVSEKISEKYVLNEMDSITNKIRLLSALSEYLKLLLRKYRDDNSPTLQFQVREVKKILMTGKTHNIRDKFILFALEETFDTVSKLKMRVPFVQLRQKNKKKIMRAFGICENHGLPLTVRESAFLFFGCCDVNMSNHAIICVKLLRDLLCQTSKYSGTDWINAKKDLPKVNQFMLQRYAAWKGLQFNDFHHETQSVEPYLTFKEVCTLRMTYLSFFHARLKHITICKATRFNSPTEYFRELYRFPDDKLAMKCLAINVKSMKNIAAVTSCALQRREEPQESTQEIPHSAVRKEKAAEKSPESMESPDIELLHEQARVLQVELAKLLLAKNEVEKSLLKVAEPPAPEPKVTVEPANANVEIPEFEECGQEEVIAVSRQQPSPKPDKPAVIQTNPEPAIGTAALLVVDSAPAMPPVTIAAPEKLISSPAMPSVSISVLETLVEKQALSEEISDKNVSSSKDDVETCIQQPMEEQTEVPSITSSQQENQKELSEGECSSSNSDECTIVKSKNNLKNRKRSIKMQTHSPSSKVPKRQKTNYESEIRQDVADLALCLNLKKLDRASDILYNKQYAHLTSPEKVRVDKFSRNYDIGDQQIAETALSLSSAANSPSKQIQVATIPLPPLPPPPPPPPPDKVAESVDQFKEQTLQYFPPPQPLPPGVESSKPKESPVKLQPRLPKSPVCTPMILTAPVVPVPLPLHLISLPAALEVTKTVSSEANLMTIPTESPVVKEIPNNVHCHCCRQPGHIAPVCPYRGSAKFRFGIPNSTGIPRCRLVACSPDTPGVMVDPSGQFVCERNALVAKTPEENEEGEEEEKRTDLVNAGQDQDEGAKDLAKEAEAVAVKESKPEEPAAKPSKPSCLTLEPEIKESIVTSGLLKRLFSINDIPVTLKSENGTDTDALNKIRTSILADFFKQRGAKRIWTKFTLKDCDEVSMEHLLNTVLDALPQIVGDLVPVGFHRVGRDAAFFAKECSDAIVAFVGMNLSISVPKKTDKLEIELELGTNDNQLAPFSVDSLIFEVVRSRIQQRDTVLDISCFHRNPDLINHCFCSMRFQKHLKNVLQFAKLLAKDCICSINLSGNDLSDLNCLFAINHSFIYATKLDLRNNRLTKSSFENISGNAAPQNFKEICLDGNPLCEDFSSSREYIKFVTKTFTKLQYLDGVKLSEVSEHHNELFVCEPSGQSFLEQFLAHYFSIFDSSRRELLTGTYHKEVLLSLTCSLNWSNASSYLPKYLKDSRNLKRLIDYAKVDERLVKGRRQVIDYLKHFPRTQHIPASFAVDMTIFNETNAKIMITGKFNEIDDKGESHLRRFHRVFTFHRDVDTFYICNEMLFVACCPAKNVQVKSTTETALPEKLDLFLCANANTNDDELASNEKSKRVVLMGRLTGMTEEWCKKCLEDVKWDQRNALIYFQQLYEKRTIPGEAFLTESTEQLFIDET